MCAKKYFSFLYTYTDEFKQALADEKLLKDKQVIQINNNNVQK